MSWHGTRKLESTFYFLFNTKSHSTGVPTTLLGTPNVQVWEDTTIGTLTGVTLSVDHWGVTGLHMVTVVATTANGFEKSKSYSVTIGQGTVGGVSVVGKVVGEFGIGYQGVADAVWDEILSGATHNISTSAGRRLRALQEYEGYSGGYIYIDTVNGIPGTEPFENGTVNNPVDNLADALVLSGALNINRFFFMPGSSVTLTQDMPYFVLDGKGWQIDMAGYDLSSTYVSEAFVTGTSTSDTLNAFFDKCLMFQTTIGSSVLTQCGIHTSMTLSEGSGNYTLVWCYQAAGTGGPTIFDFAADGGSMQADNWSGEMELRNMMSLDTCGVYGLGAVEIGTGCVGGALTVAGSLKILGNLNGIVLVDDAANVTNEIIHHCTAQGPGTGPNQIQLGNTASTVDGAYDPSMIYIYDGTGVGQTRLVYQYDGATKIATVDRNWKVAPDATSKYRIIAHPGREHVNEGLARGGTTNTIVLNALASDQDNAYKGQSVFIRSGTGEDQVGIVGSYDGATKIATLANGYLWAVIPDTTSGYAMIPMHVHPIEEITDGIKNIVVESQGSITLQQAMSLFVSALAGVTTNDGKTLLDPSGTEARIVVEIVGRNRTLVILNPSA